MLDYRLVEALASVVEQGGFERAAGTLHITQSAVSQRIKTLEERTGMVLLVRSSPPRPTAPGRILLRHYRKVRLLERELADGFGPEAGGPATLAVGVNADSLATWFLDAVEPHLAQTGVLLDLRVDDQEETHKLLRDGEVLGCISARSEPFQGCLAEPLGTMAYRLVATPTFRQRWFPEGVSAAAMERAPMQIFNRKDTMHEGLLRRALGERVTRFAAAYLPSSGRFDHLIRAGLVCGMLPEEQIGHGLDRGELVDLLPGHRAEVGLHWHCWNLESGPLAAFTEALVRGARAVLDQPLIEPDGSFTPEG